MDKASQLPVASSVRATAARASGHDHWLTVGLCAAAAMAVGFSVNVCFGMLGPPPMYSVYWLMFGVALAVATIVLSNSVEGDRHASQIIDGILPAFVVIAGALLTYSLVGIDYLIDPDTRAEFRAMELAATFFGALSIIFGRNIIPRLVLFMLFVATFAALGSSQIAYDRHPRIDVFTVQQEGAQAILDHKNPYSIHVTDIYAGDARFVSKGASANGKLTTGYPYLPLTLLMALPGYALAGDHRYAQLFAMLLAAALMALARPGRLAIAGAALYLLTPRIMFVLQNGWTEPFLVLLLAAVLLCAVRFPHLVPFALGLFFAGKQYLVIGAPLVFLLLPRPWQWRDALDWSWKILLTGAVVTLPLALWDWGAFKYSAMGAGGIQALRRLDALSFVTWWYVESGHWLGDWTPYAAALFGCVLALWRAARTPAGFAAAVGLVHLLLFSFNKHAFCNHYFFVIGAFCCAVAVANVPRPVHRPHTS